MSNSAVLGSFGQTEGQEGRKVVNLCEASLEREQHNLTGLSMSGVDAQRGNIENCVRLTIEDGRDFPCVANDNNDCGANYTAEQKLNAKEAERMKIVLDHWRDLEAMAGRFRAVLESLGSPEARQELLTSIDQGNHRVLLTAMESLAEVDRMLKKNYVDDKSDHLYRKYEGRETVGWKCNGGARVFCEKPSHPTVRESLLKHENSEREKMQREMEEFFGGRVFENCEEVSDRIVEFARLKGFAVQRPPCRNDAEQGYGDREFKTSSICRVAMKNVADSRNGSVSPDLIGVNFLIRVDSRGGLWGTSTVGTIALLSSFTSKVKQICTGYYADGNYKNYPVLSREEVDYDSLRYIVP